MYKEKSKFRFSDTVVETVVKTTVSGEKSVFNYKITIIKDGNFKKVKVKSNFYLNEETMAKYLAFLS